MAKFILFCLFFAAGFYLAVSERDSNTYFLALGGLATTAYALWGTTSGVSVLVAVITWRFVDFGSDSAVHFLLLPLVCAIAAVFVFIRAAASFGGSRGPWVSSLGSGSGAWGHGGDSGDSGGFGGGDCGGD